MYYTIYYTCFKVTEVILFIMPIIPDNLILRFCIIFIYILGHWFGIQRKYLDYKNCILEQFTPKIMEINLRENI